MSHIVKNQEREGCTKKLFWLLLTRQINISGPISSLVLEGADTSTMKGAVFNQCFIIVIREHAQEATGQRQPAGHAHVLFSPEIIRLKNLKI